MSVLIVEMLKAVNVSMIIYIKEEIKSYMKNIKIVNSDVSFYTTFITLNI